AGEIGTLARAFVAMADEVSQKAASLARASEERQRIQAELEHHAGRERLLSAVVESSDDAILAHDLDGAITAWNPAAERLYGYSAQEMIGANSEILVPPDRLAETRETRERVLRGEKIDQLETVRIAKSRGRVDVSLSISPVRAPNGAIVGVSKITRDVTENKLAQEKFRLVVEVCPSGIVMTEAGGKIVLVNTATERLFGYRRDEMIGQPVDMLLPTSLQGQHPEHRESFLADPSTRMMGAGRDLQGLRKDGTEVPIEIGLTPIRTRDGIQVLSFVIDISARKRAEQVVVSHTQDLKRSNAELEQFAYVAAHDLQEPLRMVASYTELLSQRYRGKLDERADKYIHYAVDGARRMHLLINDLLAYSRVGTQGKKLAPVQSALVLNGVIERLKPKITETGAEIVCGQLPMVKADELQLGQLFQNLIGNALKFRSERKPQIYVNAQRRNGEWEFSVADNGIGIDQQYGERIFQMFQRLHERGKYEGNGIGLAIAKKIVERHGGRIWFDCAPERGTVFHFTMPLMREEA
ncbi:MAG: PAS domain S-box protein, partial [Hyphomicrobiales bacterium]